jgi:hypothetical protein
VGITPRYYESSGEILWQVAPQTRAFGWFNEDWEAVVWVCGEARAILRADVADFLFNGCKLEVSTDESVRRISRCVDDYAQGLRLKAFQYLNVGCGCCAPKLDAISPDWFEDGFVEKELVA